MERTNSCGLKNLTFKQTKPFRATRQDDRDSFDRGASSLVSTAPRRIHAGRRLYCCPRSCVPGRPKPVGLSAAPVSIFERRYVTSGPSLQSHRAGAAEPRAPYRASDLVHWPKAVIAPMEFAERDLWNIGRSSGDQSGFMPANLTTLPHFSVSAAMCFPKSAGEPESAKAPRSANRAFILGSASAA